MAIQPTSNFDIAATNVAASLIAKDTGNLWKTFPQAMLLDETSGVGKTTFNLAALDNNLLKSGMVDWSPGTAPPIRRTLAFNTVDIQPQFKSRPRVAPTSPDAGRHRP